MEGRGGRKECSKGGGRRETLLRALQLADVTKRPSKSVEILNHVIAFNFDMHMNMLTAMPVRVWKEVLLTLTSPVSLIPTLNLTSTRTITQVFDVFSRILATLVANPELKVVVMEGSTVVDSTQMTVAEVGDEDEEYIDTGVTQMTGNQECPGGMDF